MRNALVALVVLVTLSSGCSRLRRDPKLAVEAAIEAHLAERSNLARSNMTLEVEQVKFSGDRADAEVVYRSRESSGLAVHMRYTLRRAGGRWVVESSSPVGGMGTSAHGSILPSTSHGAAGTPGAPALASPQPSH